MRRKGRPIRRARTSLTIPIRRYSALAVRLVVGFQPAHEVRGVRGPAGKDADTWADLVHGLPFATCATSAGGGDVRTAVARRNL